MTRWMLAMVAAVALFAAACGGDSDGDDAAPETSAVAAEDGGEDTTATTAASGGTSAPKDDIAISGDPNSEWCQLADDVQGQLDSVGADPFSFFSEDGITQLVGNLDRAVQVAPPEIRSDVAASRDAFTALGQVLATYDYDLLSVPPAELEAAVDQDAVTAAGDRITAYNEQVCGIESDIASDGGGEAPPAGDADEAVETFVNGLTATLPITEDQARCLAQQLDLGALAADGSLDPNDPELLDQLFSVLGDCDISIADLAG